MVKFACQNGEPCNRCGKCCHIRENFHLEIADDIEIKKQVYKRLCVLYLYPFNKYTISITHEEAKRLKDIAEKRKIKLAILPKKVIYDASRDEAKVYDWFVDHEICPFLQDKNECTIYEDRPEICRMFPKIKKMFENYKKEQTFSNSSFRKNNSDNEPKTGIQNEQLFDIQKLTSEIKPAELPYEELVERAKKALMMEGITV